MLVFCLLPTAFCLLLFGSAQAQVGDYEGRPIAAVEVALEGTPADAGAEPEFRSILQIAAGAEYSAVKVRQSLQDLFASDRVAAARVEVTEVQPGGGIVLSAPPRRVFEKRHQRQNLLRLQSVLLENRGHRGRSRRK